MRRPDKTELEFVVLAVLVMAGWVYFALRTVLALVGG